MRIVTTRKLKEFWTENKTAENALRDWIKTVHLADWKTSVDVKKTFNSASIYKDCTISDVGGNKYRIIAKIDIKIDFEKILIILKILFGRKILLHKKIKVL